VVIFATLRFAGALLVLMFTDTGLQGFLCWFALVAAGQSACSARLLWKSMPTATVPVRFDPHEMYAARHFAFGVFVITALGMLLSQLDRLTLSALRPLQEFGSYAIAATISGGIGRLVQPMFHAVYPRLSRLAATGQQQALSDLYHLASQIVAVVLAAMAGVICTYPEGVLLLWTGDAELSSQVALPLALLFAGAAINGALSLPYALQLAHGWTRLATSVNFVSVLLAIPLYATAIQRFGMAGAAAVWLALNVCILLFVMPLMHRRLLRGELHAWYSRVLPPALAAMAICALAHLAHPDVERSPAGLAWLVLVGTAALAAAALASPGTRKMLVDYVRPSVSKT